MSYPMIPTAELRWVVRKGTEVRILDGPTTFESKLVLQQKWVPLHGCVESEEEEIPRPEWKDVPIEKE